MSLSRVFWTFWWKIKSRKNDFSSSPINVTLQIKGSHNNECCVTAKIRRRRREKCGENLPIVLCVFQFEWHFKSRVEKLGK